MAKPTYEELKQRIRELEKEAIERKEKARKDSNRQWQTTFDAISDAVFLLDLQCTILTCNKAMSHLVKKPLQEIAGRKCWEVMHGTSKPIEGCLIVRMQKTLRRETMQLPIGNRWFNVAVNPLPDDEGKLAGAVHIITEITQIKQSKEAVQASEERLDVMLRSLSDHISMMDKDLNIIWANKTAKKLFGNDIVGKKCFEVYHRRKEPCKPYPCLTLRAFKDGKVHEHDTQVIDKNGETKYFHCTANVALRDKQDTPTAVIEISRDITAAKRTEETLRESEEKYRALIETTDTGYLIADESGRVVDANSEYIRISGHQAIDEILGRSVVEWTAPHDRERNAQEVTKCMKTGSVRTLEIDYIDKYDNITPIEINAKVVSTENGQRILSVCRDITDRKQAEEAVLRAKEDWENTFDSTTDMIMLLDDNHQVIRANKAAAEALHTTKESLVGKKCYEAIHERSNPIHGCPLALTMKTLKPHSTEITEPRLGGTFICSTSPIVNREGKLTGYTHSLKDITKSKQLEAQFQKAQRLEAIGTLAGGIAHDFNNLLTGIQGNVSLMLLDIDTTHSHYERLKSIEKLVQGGAKLTSHLLGYARKGRYEVKPIDLNHMLEETSETFGRTSKQVTIQRKLSEDLFAIEGDVGQIEQVLWNLLANAADAMPHGGDLILKTVNVTHKDIKGKPYDPKPGNYVLLTVSDTGIGMDKETLDHIFEPFFTTKEMGRGTGLGLASVYGIIKGHGGYIDVESIKGHGTTFSIYLPASEKRVQRTFKTTEEVIKVTGTVTVLLVDDEEVILKVGQELLKAMGCRVLTATDGKEAIEVYRKNRDKIDVVLLDIIMPNMGGGEAYDRLKEINPDIKVLLSSGHSIDNKATEMLERECDSFIQKPFNMNELSRAIKDVLGKE